MLRAARVGSPSPPAQGSPGKVSAKKHAKNSNIYKVFCKKQAKTAIFTRFSAKTSREIGIRNEDAGFPWPENFESGERGYRRFPKATMCNQNSVTRNQKLETSNKFCNRKSEIVKSGSPNTYESCNPNTYESLLMRKPKSQT